MGIKIAESSCKFQIEVCGKCWRNFFSGARNKNTGAIKSRWNVWFVKLSRIYWGDTRRTSWIRESKLNIKHYFCWKEVKNADVCYASKRRKDNEKIYLFATWVIYFRADWISVVYPTSFRNVRVDRWGGRYISDPTKRDTGTQYSEGTNKIKMSSLKKKG